MPARKNQWSDFSDCDSVVDKIMSSNRKELSDQSACPTRAMRRLLGSPYVCQPEGNEIEDCEVQPPNKGPSELTSKSPPSIDLKCVQFAEHEFAAIVDIIWDEAIVFADIWINDAQPAVEPATRLLFMYEMIASLASVMPCADDDELRAQEIEDSFTKDKADITPNYQHGQGYFVPESVSDASSINADDGSCRSNGAKSHHQALLNYTPTPSLRDYSPSISSAIDHTEHPAFRTPVPHHTMSTHCIRSDGQDTSAFVKQRPSPLMLPELPVLITSNTTNNGSEVLGSPIDASSAIPDSPTLGSNVHRNTRYSSSSSHGRERWLSDKAPTLGPLRFSRLPSEFESYLGNQASRHSSLQSNSYTNPSPRISYSCKGNRNLFPSQHELQDDCTAFLHDGLDEEIDEKWDEEWDEEWDEGWDEERRDGFDPYFSDESEDEEEDGINDDDDDTFGYSTRTHGFSDAFLSSPFFISEKQVSARRSISFNPQPTNLDKVRATKTGQNVAETSGNSDTVKPISSYNKGSPTKLDSFGTLRAYRRTEVTKLCESSRASSPDIPLARCPQGARFRTRPATPTDEQINRYLQKTARPSRRELTPTSELGYAINTTALLHPVTSIERADTLSSIPDLRPRTAPLYKKLAKKVSLSVVTSNEPSSPKSPSPPKTPKTTPTKKKFRFTSSWDRKGLLPAELRDSPAFDLSPHLTFGGIRSTPMSYTPPPSPRSPRHSSPVNHSHPQPPPQRTAPTTPIHELPPVPPRNPLRLGQTQSPKDVMMRPDLDEEVCNANFPELQQESKFFYNELDPTAKAFHAEQKLDQLRELTNTRIAYHDTADRRIDYMKHPNHSRVWESRNLRCRVHDLKCAICSDACCSYAYAERIMRDLGSLPEEKRSASKLLCLIKTWYKSVEEPTRNKSEGRPRQASDHHGVNSQTRYAQHTAIMRTYEDTFSGEKIYPGRGKLYVRGDSKIFRFQNGKTESLFLQRKNPRRIAWTTLYRRQHKKGITEEQAKKRTRRTVKQQRGIVGASLDVIKERRSQRPEAREAARKEAIAKGKEKKATSESKKKAEKAKSAAAGARGQPGRIQSKMGSKGVPNKASGKTR